MTPPPPPPQKKTTLKKPRLISVKANVDNTGSVSSKDKKIN